MLIEVVVADFFATNCWIFAEKAGQECFIVDPGISIPTLLPQIEAVIERHKLKPIAQIVTHGHLDHTFSVKPLDDRYGLPAYIHSADAAFLPNPTGLLTPGGPIEGLLAQMGMTPQEFDCEPREIRELSHGTSFEIAGMSVNALHAPGHTPGSTVFVVNDEHLISGDVLFAGSIGRTDLLHGDSEAMRKSLRRTILPLDDALIVHPGHGAETTIGRERKQNQYLQESYLKGVI